MSDDVEQLIDALRPFVRQCRLSPELDFDEVVEARDALLLYPFVGLTTGLTRRLQRRRPLLAGFGHGGHSLFIGGQLLVSHLDFDGEFCCDA